MNKHFIYVLALLLACAMPTAGAMVVYVNDTGGNLGTTIYVPINMSDTSDVGAMDISLTYNSDVLSPTGIVTTGGLTADALVINETTIYIDPVTDKETISEGDNHTVMQYGALAHNTTATSGVVNISIICSSEPPVGFNGAGSVAVVRFMVTGTGSSPLNLCAAAYNVSAPIPNATDPTKTDGYEPICTTTKNGTFTATGDGGTISIADGNAGTGATTTVTITADGVTDLSLFDINVTYNPAVVNVTDAANNPAFDVTVNNRENAADGWVRIAGFNIMSAGQTGDGILLSTLTLEAVGTTGQTSDLTLTINELKNSLGDDIIVTTDDGLFTVGKPKDGDIDGSGGNPAMSDAMYLAKHVVGLSGYETIYADGDIDGSGGNPAMSDAMYLAKHVVGLSGYETMYPE